MGVQGGSGGFREVSVVMNADCSTGRLAEHVTCHFATDAASPLHHVSPTARVLPAC